MKFFITLMILLTATVEAETVKFKTPAINGKLTANNLELTDWQTVMSCHFNNRGSRKEILRYPKTTIAKLEGQFYSLKIKASSLSETLAGWELQNCAYKLTLIGKNLATHQLAFGEILLAGRESGVMSESELLTMQDQTLITKILTEKTRDLMIGFGKDGGIVEE